MTLYIYADETEFELNNDKMIGSGLLVVNSPIGNIVITEALNNLQNDPDIEKKQFKARDMETFKKGHFHATDDSPNAHSHFCKSIIKYAKGNFIYSYYNPEKEKPWRKERDLNDLQKLTLGLTSLSTFYTTQEIDFTIEERNGFNFNHVHPWWEDLCKQIEYTIYDSPEIPVKFPLIKLKTADKRNPGLQVTDFILWSMNRSKGVPSHGDWYKRLELKLSSAFNEVEGPIEKGSYLLGEETESPLPSYPDYCLPVKDPIGAEGLINTYILIERYLKYISRQLFPPHAEHLKVGVVNIVKQLSNRDKSFSNDLIQESSSVFIRLFDTLPIYDSLTEDDKNTWSNLLTARKMAALFLRKDLPNGVESCDYITIWRTKIIRENPQLLEMQNYLDGSLS